MPPRCSKMPQHASKMPLPTYLPEDTSTLHTAPMCRARWRCGRRRWDKHIQTYNMCKIPNYTYIIDKTFKLRLVSPAVRQASRPEGQTAGRQTALPPHPEWPCKPYKTIACPTRTISLESVCQLCIPCRPLSSLQSMRAVTPCHPCQPCCNIVNHPNHQHCRPFHPSAPCKPFQC